ncbi:hypothetical protein C9439_07755 [archaeon SCG-AAA382B04]|nr:hypothetical protein C9439_07755 [archaeon SCG-AAA382B04]
MIGSIISAIWLVIPAYVPNSSAVLFQGQTPLDLRKNFIDGKRILGDGKTIKGFIGGSLAGIAIGIIQIFLSEKVGLLGFDKNILIIASLAIGSMVGDSLFSFIKRRIGLKRGYPFPLFDQLDFLIGALFLTRLLHKNWFYETFTINYILIIFILTPIIHLFINYVGYKLGKKEEPW